MAYIPSALYAEGAAIQVWRATFAQRVGRRTRYTESCSNWPRAQAGISTSADVIHAEYGATINP